MQKNRSSATSKMLNYLVFGVSFLAILKVSWHTQSLNVDAAKTNKTLQLGFRTDFLKTPVLPLVNSDLSEAIVTEDTIVIGRRDLPAAPSSSSSKQKVTRLKSAKSPSACSLARNQKVSNCDCKLKNNSSVRCRKNY